MSFVLSELQKKLRILNRIKNFTLYLFGKLFLLDFPNKWSVHVIEKFMNLFYSVKIANKEFKLLSNSPLLLYRSKTFFSKEPETVRWIESIPRDGVYYDVGANVGLYAILASQYCRQVYAFEPVAVNYSILNQNLLNNRLDDKVTAYCIAVSDKSGFDTMRLSSGVIGSAHHTFANNKDACHQEFSPVFKQGAYGISLDELVDTYGLPFPTYLKVDVDGNEWMVIDGAKKMLQDSRLKSILIELNKNLKADDAVVKKITDSGFLLKETGEEASFNGMKIGNLIFYRR